MPPSNAQIAELLRTRAEDEPQDHRRRALLRAARLAYGGWGEQAADMVSAGRPLTELTGIGPWLAAIILDWLTHLDPDEVPEPPLVRRGFLTVADVEATLAEHPDWRNAVRADLQMHTTYSDGRTPLRDMVETCARDHSYEFIAITDHSKTLTVANGMDEARLAAEGLDIDRVNTELRDEGTPLRVLKGIEMDLTPEGEGDMDPRALARLDLVLGAFHSKLRERTDQTERYVAAVRNPTIDVLAHPRTRMFDRRPGLDADWPRVFAEAAAADIAVEIDAHPYRQDLQVEVLEAAREAGVRISIGTDAHHPSELANLGYGLAAALRAGIPRDRILNFAPVEDVLAWTRERRGRAAVAAG